MEPITNTDKDNILEYDLKSDKQIENINVDYRNSNYKFIKIYFEEISNFITIKQDFKLGKGGIFWDGSYVLTKIFYENFLKFETEGKKILELGAGTALPSIFSLAVNSNHKVTITDIAKFIQFIEDNVALNKALISDTNSNSYKIEKLHWENKVHINTIKTHTNKFDYIIGSEIIYLDEYFDDLMNLLKEFSDINTQIFLSYKIRLPEMVDSFLSKLTENNFTYTYIQDDIVKKFYPCVHKLKIIIVKLNS
jgi:predicted nicotinamide N-methyase